MPPTQTNEPEPVGLAQVKINTDPRHRLSQAEFQRVIAQGGSVLYNGEIYTSLESLPEEYVHGEAVSIDSPFHPTAVAARERRRKQRDLAAGVAEPEPDEPSAPTPAGGDSLTRSGLVGEPLE